MALGLRCPHPDSMFYALDSAHKEQCHRTIKPRALRGGCQRTPLLQCDQGVRALPHPKASPPCPALVICAGAPVQPG